MSDVANFTSLARLSGTAAKDLVMHREPMLLLDKLVESTADCTICEAVVSADWLFVTPGSGVPAYVGVEIMAQCVAVHAGARARIEGFGPPLGYLLGTRHFRSSTAWLGIGETYRVVCKELIRDAQGMGSYDCSIHKNEELIAQVRLAVLEKERGRPLGA